MLRVVALDMSPMTSSAICSLQYSGMFFFEGALCVLLRSADSSKEGLPFARCAVRVIGDVVLNWSIALLEVLPGRPLLRRYARPTLRSIICLHCATP